MQKYKGKLIPNTSYRTSDPQFTSALLEESKKRNFQKDPNCISIKTAYVDNEEKKANMTPHSILCVGPIYKPSVFSPSLQGSYKKKSPIVLLIFITLY